MVFRRIGGERAVAHAQRIGSLLRDVRIGEFQNRIIVLTLSKFDVYNIIGRPCHLQTIRNPAVKLCPNSLAFTRPADHLNGILPSKSIFHLGFPSGLFLHLLHLVGELDYRLPPFPDTSALPVPGTNARESLQALDDAHSSDGKR